MTPNAPDEKRPRRGLKVTAWVVGVLAVVIAVTGAFGGLKKKPDGPQHARPGQVIDQNPFRVQVTGAQAGPAKAGLGPKTNQLVVWMQVRNQGRESLSLGKFIEGLAIMPGTGEYLNMDGSRPKPGSPVRPDSLHTTGRYGDRDMAVIHPRMSVTVQVAWRMAPNAMPRSTKITLYEWEYRLWFTSDTLDWMTGSTFPVKAEVTVPVRPVGGS